MPKFRLNKLISSTSLELFTIVLVGHFGCSFAINNLCMGYLDSCFSEIGESLQCHTDYYWNGNCKNKDTKDFCLSMEDALNCTETIVNWDCEIEARSYSSWMKGLKAVQSLLCTKDNSLIQNLLDSPNCWNPGKFLSCTEENVGFTHVTDLLSAPLDENECNMIMASVAICNAEAERNRNKCKGTAKAIVMALTTFFAKSSCMNIVTKELLEEYCQAESNVKVIISVSLTILIVCFLIAVGFLVLMRSKVVTVNKRFRLYNDAEDKDFIIN